MEKEMVDPKTEPLWLMDRNYMTSLLHGLETISISEWKTYFEHVIQHHTAEFIPELPSDSYIHIHNFGFKRRHPHHMLKRDEKSETECLKATHQLFPAIIGNIYIHRHLHNYTLVKTQITEVVENIRHAFVEMITKTPWMSQQSQEKVIEKLNAIIVRVIHPNYYEEEPFAKRMTLDNYLRNLNIIRRYVATRNFELWTKNIPNRDEIQRFGSPISTVNAFYSPITNTVTVFAGILTKPFYSPDFDPVALYAGIGMIIGHELGGHGLDRDSRLFDKNGLVTLIDPWTKKEQDEFEKRVKMLIDEYDAPFGCVNEDYGEQTIREDMADLSGITAAYLALKKQVPTLTKAQTKQFFEVFGQMWAETYDKEYYCQRVNSDEHAVSLYRVDKTLRQMNLYRETYGCKIGDPMVNPNPVIIYGEELKK
jgi:predicted metalloendopeptidase